MWRGVIVMVLAACSLGVVLPGCGGSESEGASDAQLEAAKMEGEEAAQEKSRIDSLEKQVKKLRREAKHRRPEADRNEVATDPAPVPESDGSRTLRTFHAPSGNVSCEITSSGALCSVASTAETFSVFDGQSGQISSGASLPRGAGELIPFGTVVSAGSIECTVPRSDEPRGIVCQDLESGHGFEASRVESRQRAY